MPNFGPPCISYTVSYAFFDVHTYILQKDIILLEAVAPCI